jgi:MFS family permease
MGLIFVYLGVILIVTQGGLVRRLIPRFGEKPVMMAGLLSDLVGFLIVGITGSIGWFYVGLAIIGIGTGLVNPSVSSLVSLYSDASNQGRMLGVFRSLGSLARGFAPIGACLLYWWQGATTTYIVAALVLIGPWIMAMPLPRPAK